MAEWLRRAADSEGSVAAARVAWRVVGCGEHRRYRGRRCTVEYAAARHELCRQHRLNDARDVVGRGLRRAAVHAAAGNGDELRIGQRLGDDRRDLRQ